MAIRVQYNDKIRIQDLTELSTLQIPDNTYLIDTSDVSTATPSDVSTTFKASLEDFGGQNDIINKACAKRYWTETNNLQHTDLRLFSAYAQDNTDHEKKVIFETHPIVDANPPLKNSEISTTQLLTKFDVEDFQSYLTKKHLNAYSCIPAYNWENEYNIDHMSGTKIPRYDDISSFNDLLKKVKHDSRATYKFEYTTLSPEKNNVERTTNIVPLNQFKYNDTDITAIVHYSVAGFVAVKSDLDDQRSGTIYLEARPAGNSKAEWQTIDSAVFKFIKNKEPKDNPKYSPGTYVTLSGFLSTEFETRLKLNLKSHGYSMNLYELRDKNQALTNHYVNTFIGFVHIPDAISNPTNFIYFTNINYQSYFYKGQGLHSYSYQLGQNETIKTFDTVSELLEAFKTDLSNSALEISSSEMQNPKKFKINGLRLTPTGEIFKLTDPITVEAGTTVYPSYTSGTVEAVKPAAQRIAIKNYPIAHTFARSNLLNKINYSKLKVLKNNSWNEETEIYGKISSEISATNDTRGLRRITGRTEHQEEERIGTLSFGGTVISVADYATESPRRQYHGASYTFDFSRYLANVRLIPGTQITCSMYIWPDKWGKGSGNESYGRVYTGGGSVVNSATLSTKNMSATFTKYLCQGSRWNYSGGGTTISFTQPVSQKSFTIASYADTGSDDGRRETWFGVYANNITIQYKYIYVRDVVIPPYDVPTGEIMYYGAYISGKADCRITKNDYTYAYPSSFNNVVLYHNGSQYYPQQQGGITISGLTNDTYFQNITATNLNYVPVSNAPTYTELTVFPYPQNLVL